MSATIDATNTQKPRKIQDLEMFAWSHCAMMAKVRDNPFDSASDLSTNDRNFVLDIIFLFENPVDSPGCYSKLLRPA